MAEEMLESVKRWASAMDANPDRLEPMGWEFTPWQGYIQEACNMFNFAYQHGMRGEWSPIVSWGRYG